MYITDENATFELVSEEEKWINVHASRAPTPPIVINVNFKEKSLSKFLKFSFSSNTFVSF